MSSQLGYETGDEASENELLERSLSVWKGWNSIEWEDFAPTTLDIHTACSIGHYDWLRTLILKGDKLALDRKNLGGWSPLMYACYIGHDNIVELLIAAGCDMNMKNSRGHTPLMLAATCGNENVAYTLVRKGAELELCDKTGWTALFHATYAGHQNFVAFLLEAGTNKDALEPSSGTTPFMEAAAEGHEIIVQLFLQHGVNIHAKAHNGDTARSLALMNGHVKIVSLIDNHLLNLSCLRPGPGLGYHLTSRGAQSRKLQPPAHSRRRLKSQGPSIRDGPEAIARMIDRTRQAESMAYPDMLVPKGYVTFPINGADKEDTRISYRDVTSPINPEDYKDSSGSRAMSDLEDFNDDSTAFTKTGAITIKSSSNSSGGLAAALGLSREGSLDSDDSHSSELATTSSEDIPEFPEIMVDSRKVPNPSHVDGTVFSPSSGQERFQPGSDGVQLPSWHGDNHFLLKHCHSLPPSVQVVSPSHLHVPPETGVAPVISQHEPPLLPSAQLSLPKDDMSQVEIVNRFLKNLTVNNPRTSNGQYRWAEETGAAPSAGDYLKGFPHRTSPAAATLTSLTPDGGVFSPSTCNDLDSKLTEGSLVEHSPPGQYAAAPKAPKTSRPRSVDGLPGPSFSDSTSVQVQGHQVLWSNHHLHHQKDPFEQIVNQHWTHHPLVNHHHLHSRHLLNHSTLSHNLQTENPGGHLGHATPGTTSANTLPTQPPTISHSKRPDTCVHELAQENLSSHVETTSHLQENLSSHVETTSHLQENLSSHVETTSHLQENLSSHVATTSHLQENLSSHVETTSHLQENLYSHVETTSHLQENLYIHVETTSHLQENLYSHVETTSHLQENLYSNVETTSHLQENLSRAVSSVADTRASPQGETVASGQGFMGNLSPGVQSLPPFERPCAGVIESCDIHGSVDVVPISHLPGSKLNKMASRPVSLPPSCGQVGLNPADSPVDNLALPATSVPPLQQLAAPLPTAAAMVIIPGHLTSQPVSCNIGWDQLGLPEHPGPRDLAEMLQQLGLSKYLETFQEQGVDLQVFLSMTDSELKELGIRLFGPRKKMTNAIARWHSSAPAANSSSLEQAYADRLEAEMQEMAIQLSQAYESMECLKAQVLQEQQLRSVTETCLMEERVAWDQVRHIVLTSRSKMCHLGDFISQLRSHHTELRKHLQQVSRQPAEACQTREPDNSPHGQKVAHQDNMQQVWAACEQCLKDMGQTLSHLVVSCEHLLKSTHRSGLAEEHRT